MRLRDLFNHRARRDEDLDEELRAHIAMATRDRIDRGENARQASASARREFGNRTLVKEVTRQMWGWSAFERLAQDLRCTARILRKSPGFAAVAMLSIALGIGVNTAIFSLIDAVMLKSLAVPDPNQLVMIGDPTRTGALSQGPGRPDIFSYPFFERFRQQQRVFTDIYANGRCEHLDVSLPDGTPIGTSEQRIRGRFVSGNFFSLLGVNASPGRVFTEDEVRVPGSAPVIVISRSFSQRVFGVIAHDGHQTPCALGGDCANPVGRSLVINGSKFTVIGVAISDFSGDIVGAPTDIWFPIPMQTQANPGRNYLKDPMVSWIVMMGRVKPGVSLAQADASVQVLTRRLFREFYTGKQSTEGLRDLVTKKIQVTPGAKGFSRLRHDFASPLFILMGIVGLVLLICCANIANLQLARATARSREMSVRLAIGAAQSRLVRQLLTESLVLSIAGAALGLMFASWGSHLLLRITDASGPSLEAHLDSNVLLFTAGAAILSGLLFGLAPAMQARRLDLIAALRENKAQPGGFAKTFGKALVVLQIVFSLVLLVSAGLFIRTLQNLEKLDLGYSRHGLVLANIDFQAAGYTDQRMNQLIRHLLERLQQLPGVDHASASENGLFSGTDSDSAVEADGFDARSLADKSSRSDRISADYFETVGTPILAGRGIGAQDTEKSARIAVINDTMARFYFPHENPLGRHLFEPGPDGKRGAPIAIVGVVRDVKENHLRQPTPRRYYTALAQHQPDDPIDALNLEIRTRVTSAAMLEAVRHAIKNIDPKLAIVDLKTADELIDDELDQEKLVAKLSGFFGLLAVLLAAIGLYGVMSYLTVRRTTEIGVRMALGARRPTVMAMVLGETFRLVGAGVIMGIVASLLFASFLTKVLFGLSPFDPLTTISAAAVIAVAAGLATYLPARRASKIDPMIALRYE
jgi:predicted permease